MPKTAEEQKAYNKEYYRNNKKKWEKYGLSYDERKEKISPEQRAKAAARQRRYYRDNKDEILKRNRAAQKEWYQDNREEILQEKREWRLRMLGTLEYRFKRAVQTAKRREISFLLTFDQFVEVASHPCYYCDGKFCDPVLEGGGLDRIDSNKGYEISNVVSCGWRCNSIKMDDLTMEEAKAAIEAILQVRLKVIAQHEKEVQVKSPA